MIDRGVGTFLDVQRHLDEAFERLIYRRWAIPAPSEWSPRVDIHETDDAYLIEVDLPGVPPERVEIRAAERDLTIAGTRLETSLEGVVASRRERECGSFRRSLALAHAIAPERVEAEYHHGTCRIRLIKRRSIGPTSPSEPAPGRPIRIAIP